MRETKLTFQDSALDGRTGKARTALLVGAAESAP